MQAAYHTYHASTIRSLEYKNERVVAALDIARILKFPNVTRLTVFCVSDTYYTIRSTELKAAGLPTFGYGLTVLTKKACESLLTNKKVVTRRKEAEALLEYLRSDVFNEGTSSGDVNSKIVKLDKVSQEHQKKIMELSRKLKELTNKFDKFMSEFVEEVE